MLVPLACVFPPLTRSKSPRMSNHDNCICPTFDLKHASVSDLGMRRTNNQDSLAVFVTKDVATWVSRGHLLMVADGMGAHAAGELASKLAVDNITHNYFKLRELYPPAALRQAIRDANNAVHAKGQSSIGFQGMGTTCSCLVLLPQGALVAHIGDSRVYRLRGDLLEQLTFDHSLVWEMAAAGQMSQEDVPAYIPKNVITRSLGPHPSVQVDLEGPFNCQAGDKFLVCSDGLSGPVSDEEIGIVLRCLGPQDAADTLVDLANFRGGPDNISLIVTEIDGTAPQVSPESPSESRSPHASSGPLWWLAWLAAGACLATLAYCLAREYWAGAIGSAIGLLAAIGAGIALTASTVAKCVAIGPIGGPYGNGPYRKFNCTPNGRIVSVLADIASQLSNDPNVRKEDREVNWDEFEQLRSKASAANEHDDFIVAVVNYSAAIRLIMKQLRANRPTVEMDSERI